MNNHTNTSSSRIFYLEFMTVWKLYNKSYLDISIIISYRKLIIRLVESGKVALSSPPNALRQMEVAQGMPNPPLMMKEGVRYGLGNLGMNVLAQRMCHKEAQYALVDLLFSLFY